jgi:hypothetical protein
MLNNPMQKIFIVGDVNQLSLENTESIFNLKQMVKNPTCNNNILDVFTTNFFDMYNTPLVCSSLVKTDHKAVYAFPHIPANTNSKTAKIIYDTRLHNRLKLSKEITATNWELLSNIKDINLLVDTFNMTLNSIKERCIPKKIIHISDKDPYWSSPLIKSLIKKRNKTIKTSLNMEHVDKLNNKIVAMINNNVNFIGKKIRNSTKINSAD